MNRGSTADFVPPPVCIGIPSFVLAEETRRRRCTSLHRIVFREPEDAVDDGPDVQVEVNEGRGVRVGVRVQEEAREHRTDHTK